MTSNTAPAHPHATGVAVYPALFFIIFDENDCLKQVVAYNQFLVTMIVVEKNEWINEKTTSDETKTEVILFICSI